MEPLGVEPLGVVDGLGPECVLHHRDQSIHGLPCELPGENMLYWGAGSGEVGVDGGGALGDLLDRGGGGGGGGGGLFPAGEIAMPGSPFSSVWVGVEIHHLSCSCWQSQGADGGEGRVS